MLGLSQEELAEYGRFVARFASLGYARAFAATGDFAEAQALVERAFAEGCATWFWRNTRGRDAESTFDVIMEQAVNGRVAEGTTSVENPFSFSRLSKLQQAEEAVGILRSFEGDDLIALFLRHVEEVPEETICSTLRRTAADLADLDSRLSMKIEAWRPSDPEARDVFARTLRQHMLSPSFSTGIMTQATARGAVRFKLGIIVGPIVRVVACVGLTIAIFSVAHAQHWRYRAWYDDAHPYVQEGMLIAGLPWLGFFDALILALSWRLRKTVAGHERGRLAMDAGVVGWLVFMRMLDHLGVMVVTMACFYVVSSGTFRRCEPLMLGFLAARAVWWFGAASCIVTVGLRVLLARGRP